MYWGQPARRASDGNQNGRTLPQYTSTATLSGAPGSTHTLPLASLMSLLPPFSSDTFPSTLLEVAQLDFIKYDLALGAECKHGLYRCVQVLRIPAVLPAGSA